MLCIIRKNSEADERSVLKRLAEFNAERNKKQRIQKHYKRFGRNFGSRGNRVHILLRNVRIYGEIAYKPIKRLSKDSRLRIERFSSGLELLGHIISNRCNQDPSSERCELQDSRPINSKIELQRIQCGLYTINSGQWSQLCHLLTFKKGLSIS